MATYLISPASLPPTLFCVFYTSPLTFVLGCFHGIQFHESLPFFGFMHPFACSFSYPVVAELWFHDYIFNSWRVGSESFTIFITWYRIDGASQQWRQQSHEEPGLDEKKSYLIVSRIVVS
jgi:hypothetical protein